MSVLSYAFKDIASPFLRVCVCVRVCVCEQMSLNCCDNLEEFVVDISPLWTGLNSTVLNCILNYYNLDVSNLHYFLKYYFLVKRLLHQLRL